jgi:hypothetical protein
MCPVCAGKIAQGRCDEVTDVLTKHHEAGGSAFMATFTIPHHAMQSCKELRMVVSGSWRRVKQGAPWKRMKERCGYVGDARALEVTKGNAGWHPHIHALIFFKPGTPDALAKVLGEWMFERWQRAVRKAGYGWCSRAAFTFEKASRDNGAAEYVAKWGAAVELTKATVKQGRKGGRTSFQILADYEAFGRKRDAALFREYAKAFKGARQLTWAGDIRRLYDAPDEATDEQLAEEPGLAETHCGIIERSLWKEIERQGLTAHVLNAADKDKERGSTVAMIGVETFLKAHGIAVKKSTAPSLEQGRFVPSLSLAQPAREPIGEYRGTSPPDTPHTCNST